MSAFHLALNGTNIQIAPEGFDPDLYLSGHPGVSITATAHGKEQPCYWWYKRHGDVFCFNDRAFDRSNEGHRDFRAWLCWVATTDSERAEEFMHEILAQVDTSDVAA